MPQVQAKRRLVKSPPELWSELSDAAALARHLGEFGEIRITRLEPESRVVWEGDRANGSVQLDAAGWGTQVILTVDVDDLEDAEAAEDVEAAEPEAVEAEAPAIEPEAPAIEPEPDPEAEPEPEPEPVAVPDRLTVAPQPVMVSPRRRGFLARLFGWDDQRVESVMESAREAVAVEPEPVAEPESEPVAVEPEPEPEPEDEDTVALLEHVLDQLGQAHHRPFSRA